MSTTPTVTATVKWPSGQNNPIVSPDPICVSEKKTTITWNAGEGVASFTISGLPKNEFKPAGCTQAVKSFSSTDKCNDKNTYSYTVSATQTTTGRIARHDPKIENEVPS